MNKQIGFNSEEFNFEQNGREIKRAKAAVFKLAICFKKWNNFILVGINPIYCGQVENDLLNKFTCIANTNTLENHRDF